MKINGIDGKTPYIKYSKIPSCENPIIFNTKIKDVVVVNKSLENKTSKYAQLMQKVNGSKIELTALGATLSFFAIEVLNLSTFYSMGLAGLATGIMFTLILADRHNRKYGIPPEKLKRYLLTRRD